MQGYVQAHPLKLSGDPAEAAGQWAALSPELRDAYIRYASDIVGNTDGLPAEDRSAANKIVLQHSRQESAARLAQDQHELDQYLAHLRGWTSRLPMPGDVYNFEVGGFTSAAELARLNELHQAGALDQKIHANAEAVQSKLDGAEKLGTNSYLLIYRPEDFRGDGRAAIAFGNPDHAANTAIIVPGLNATVQSQYSNNPDADNLYRQMTRTNRGQATSVISYMGYDAPEFDSSVLTENRAKAGARLLMEDVSGWQASHDTTPSHVTVIGHSYGSTTVADAAARGMGADDFVLVGSPGMGQATATDFPAGHLYTGSASADPVADLSAFGQDPATPGSGAIRFHAESSDRGERPIWELADHSKYFAVSEASGGPSESLANIAKIANGAGIENGDIAALKPRDGAFGVDDPEKSHQVKWGSSASNR